MASNGSFQGKTETEDSDIVSLSVEKQGHIHVLHGDGAGPPPQAAAAVLLRTVRKAPTIVPNLLKDLYLSKSKDIR